MLMLEKVREGEGEREYVLEKKGEKEGESVRKG